MDIFEPFSGPWWEGFDWKQGTCVFKKITKMCYILGKKKQEKSALEANIKSFQQMWLKYLAFPHPGNSLMTWPKFGARVYTYFNIENA